MRLKKAGRTGVLRKFNEMRRFSSKNLSRTKDLMGKQMKSNNYCEPITKKFYQFVSGNVGVLYNPFKNEDVRYCYFVFKHAVLPRF